MRGSSGARARGRAPTRTHTNTEQPRRQGGGAGAAMRGRSPAGSSVQPVVVALPRVHVAAPRHGLRMSTGSAVASAIGLVRRAVGRDTPLHQHPAWLSRPACLAFSRCGGPCAVPQQEVHAQQLCAGLVHEVAFVAKMCARMARGWRDGAVKSRQSAKSVVCSHGKGLA